MERFSQRDSVLLGHSPQRSFGTPSSSPYRNCSVDFHDVFGGPPRRSSYHEMPGSRDNDGDDDEAPSCLWPLVSEKPVFGEEYVNGRRYTTSGDFFDDIFKGDESLNSTPKRHEPDPFSSAPSSRVLSPARPLPPKNEEPFPSQLSLPAKLTLPTFGLPTRGLYKNNKDGTSNGRLGFSYSPNPPSPLSRSSTKGQEELRNKNLKPSYRQSLLSQEFFQGTEGQPAPDLIAPANSEKESHIEKDSGGSEALSDVTQFHFSIYKWASKGMPLEIPLRGRSDPRAKGKVEVQRSLSSKERALSGSPLNASSSACTRLSSIKNEEIADISHPDTSNQNGVGSSQIIEEETLVKPLSETSSSLPNRFEDASRDDLSRTTAAAESSRSLPKMGFSGKKKEPSMTKLEVKKPESNPLYSLLKESDQDGQGAGNDETQKGEAKQESKAKFTKKLSALRVGSVKDRKHDGNKGISNVVEVKENNLEAPSANSGEHLRRSQVKGKVKDFVRIFNEEAMSKPKDNIYSQNKESKEKQGGTSGATNEVHVYHKQHEKANPGTQTSRVSGTTSSGGDHYSSSSSTVPARSGTATGDKDASFHKNYSIKDIDQEVNGLPKSWENHEEIQDLDAKIRKWSNGKEGNIRSLLSTLQYVLWPESGWKPVPLVDIIEGNAVKRAYQKALLCLHPDKLQQKGASSHQKYIAEKIFDMLQEAWTHFNLVGAI